VGLNAKGSDETKDKPNNRRQDKDEEEIDEEIVVEEEENKTENREKERSGNKTTISENSPISSQAFKERQFPRFLDIFKRLQINIPFSEALEQMPTYAKFMKEILTKKRRFIEEETIELKAECSAINQKMLPPKFKDPGSLTLLVTIESLVVGKALLNLGASINLMSLYMLKKIGEL